MEPIPCDKLAGKENRRMKKQWLIALMSLIVCLATAGTATAFALTGSESGSVPQGDTNAPEASDMDPKECNWIRDSTTCVSNPTIEDPPLPTYEDWVGDHATEGLINSTIEDPPLELIGR
jgi:hypothetical protein